eukprot:scaffold215190_cov19-Tisochrysis_lutea.AAC.1
MALGPAARTPWLRHPGIVCRARWRSGFRQSHSIAALRAGDCGRVKLDARPLGGTEACSGGGLVEPLQRMRRPGSMVCWKVLNAWRASPPAERLPLRGGGGRYCPALAALDDLFDVSRSFLPLRPLPSSSLSPT